MRNHPVKKILWLMAVVTAMSLMMETETSSAAAPVGFAYTTVDVKAEIGIACVEAQHGTFSSPLIIDPQTASDQSFSSAVDELVKCTKGVVFTVKVSSANGTALDQNCTSSGVSGMALKSASWPGDTVAYTFMCEGDTTGTGHFTGAGFNTSKAMGISIKIAAADAQEALAHADYSDTITMTISY
jgi:hypothetical protein